MMKRLSVLLLVVLISGFAQALINYTVDNSSFELPGTVKCKNWDGETTYPDVPGWTDGDATAADSGVESTYATDGVWAAFVKSDDDPVYQVTSNVIDVANEGYTLTVDARATSGGAGANLQLTMELFYDVSGVQTALTSASVVVPDRVDPYPFETFMLSIDSASIPVAAIGNPIGIKFNNDVNINGGGTWIGFDNVRLTSEIPEPATMVLLGLGSLLAVRRKRS